MKPLNKFFLLLLLQFVFIVEKTFSWLTGSQREQICSNTRSRCDDDCRNNHARVVCQQKCYGEYERCIRVRNEI